MSENNLISKPNQHIEEYFDYYFEGKKQFEYAILLNGEWGSGKTWFVKKYIEKQKSLKKKVAYISLNGLSKTSEIDEAIFKCIHPVLGSKQAKLTGQILKGALKATLRIDLDGDSKSDGSVNASVPDIKLPDYLKIDDNFILIFDDLERCELKIEETLGYINYFVEQENIKVLVVSNDTEIKESDNFLRKKEKLIGATFNYSEDQDLAIKSILEEIDNFELKEKLIAVIPLITETFNRIGYKNLRAFKQSVFDFERFYRKDTFEWKGNFDNDIFQKILKAFLILSLENKKGTFEKKILEFKKNEAVENNKKDDLPSLISKSIRGIDSKDSEKFMNKYNLSLKDFVFSKEQWHKILNLNVLNDKNINDELYEAYFRLKEEQPTWLKLWYYLNLSEIDFESLVIEAQKSIENSKLNNITDILHTVSMLIYFKEKNLIFFSVENLLVLAVDQFKKNVNLRENIKKFNYFDISDESGGYGLYARELPMFKEFIKDLAQAYEDKYVEKNIERVKELFSLMENDSYEFYQQLTNKYFDYPILNSLNPVEFLDQLLKIEYRNAMNALDALNSRYTINSQSKIYSQEEDWFQKIIDSTNQKLVLSTGLLEKHKIQDKFLPKLIGIQEKAYKG